MPSSKQLKTLHNASAPLIVEESVEHRVLHIPDVTVEELQFVTYYMLDRLDFYILSYELLKKEESWSEVKKLKKLKFRGDALPPFLASPP